MRVTIVVLILSVAVLGQNPSPKQAASVPRNAQQSDSPKAPIPPPALQPAPAEPPPQPEPTASNPPRAAAEPKESFSELTLFLFGSGFALFIALLGWSDQIRGIDKDTREMERLFMEDSGIHKRQFRCIVKPESPDQQLEVLTELVNAGKIKTVDTVRLLRAFTDWKCEWSKIEKLSVWRYNLTILLTFALFASGTTSLFTTPTGVKHLFLFVVRTEMLVLLLPMGFVLLLFAVILLSSRREKELRKLLNSMSEMV